MGASATLPIPGQRWAVQRLFVVGSTVGTFAVSGVGFRV